jgi:hypothetical protein
VTLVEVVTAGFIILHIPGGGVVDLDPHKIITMREPAIEGHISNAIHCIINTDDGKFIGVTETCDDVINKLE